MVMAKQGVLILAIATGALVLAGCGRPADKVPNYRELIIGVPSYTSSPRWKTAESKCNESATDLERAANPWCGVLEKANACANAIILLEAREGHTEYLQGLPGIAPAAPLPLPKEPLPECPPR